MKQCAGSIEKDSTMGENDAHLENWVFLLKLN